MGPDSSELRRQWVEMAVGRHTKEVTFLQNDMVDLIMSARSSDRGQDDVIRIGNHQSRTRPGAGFDFDHGSAYCT